MVLVALLALLGAATLSLSAPLALLAVQLDCATLSYNVQLDGVAVLNSMPLRVVAQGAVSDTWRVTDERNVVDADGLGAFSGTECSLTDDATGMRVQVAAFVYPSAAAAATSSLIRFTITLPDGAQNTSYTPAANHFGTITSFPALNSTGMLAHSISWADSFVSPRIDTVSYGMAGGPLLMHGADVTQAAVLFSPLDRFLSSALGDDLGDGNFCSGSCFTAGPAASFLSLPPGFRQSFVLVAGAGITGTAMSWGAVLRGYYAATSTNVPDLSLQTLGYQTDNGAQLCFGCANQVLDKCLLEEKAVLDAAKVPIRYLSFQNAWWQSQGESAPWCVGKWEAVPNKVPMGIPAFQEALGLPLQLYAPYFCNTSDYPSNFSMVRSSTALPGCDDFDFYDAAPDASLHFYNYLFDLGMSYGMTMFEPDFLNQNHNCVPLFIEQIGAADGFFRGQTDAAFARGIPIQWCFCTPYLLMFTLETPSVTNFRVSLDYFYGGSYHIGTSSIIVAALGKAPSKDTFWTTDNGAQATTHGGCDRSGCPPDHSNAGGELHTILATLTTGPVGFSDAPNETDAVLIGRTCDSAGNLLQPSMPILSVDSTFDPTPGGAPAGGFVLATHTAVQGSVWMRFILGHQLTAPFVVRNRDLWPAPAAASWAVADARQLRSCADGASIASCGINLTTTDSSSASPLLTLPAVPKGTDPFTAYLFLAAPVCSSGVSLLGEPQKITAISVQRFTAIQCTPTGIAFSVAGADGETISLALALAATAAVRSISFPKPAAPQQCTFSVHGATLTCHPQ